MNTMPPLHTPKSLPRLRTQPSPGSVCTQGKEE